MTKEAKFAPRGRKYFRIFPVVFARAPRLCRARKSRARHGCATFSRRVSEEESEESFQHCQVIPCRAWSKALFTPRNLARTTPFPHFWPSLTALFCSRWTSCNFYIIFRKNRRFSAYNRLIFILFRFLSVNKKTVEKAVNCQKGTKYPFFACRFL